MESQEGASFHFSLDLHLCFLALSTKRYILFYKPLGMFGSLEFSAFNDRSNYITLCFAVAKKTAS